MADLEEKKQKSITTADFVFQHGDQDEAAKFKTDIKEKAERVKLIFKYMSTEEAKKITVYSDTDFAGCRRTRKSTTGLAVFFGAHLLQFGLNCRKPSRSHRAKLNCPRKWEAL